MLVEWLRPYERELLQNVCVDCPKRAEPWLEIMQRHPDAVDWRTWSQCAHPTVVGWLGERLDQVCWHALSENPGALHLLEQNLDKVVWTLVCETPGLIELARAHPEHLFWPALSGNPNAIDLLADRLRRFPNPEQQSAENRCPNEIDWCWLSSNPNAVPLLERNRRHVAWHMVVFGHQYDFLDRYANKLKRDGWAYLANKPEATAFVTRHLDKFNRAYLSGNSAATHLLDINWINWRQLSKNSHPDAVALLTAYPNRLDWKAVSSNPGAVDLLRQNLDKVDWAELSLNTSALCILEQHRDRIDWYHLAQNPAIFVEHASDDTR
jgi:hypothetical protein